MILLLCRFLLFPLFYPLPRVKLIISTVELQRFFRLDLLASEGYLNVIRDTLELRFQVRASTYYQLSRDQQYYIDLLLDKQCRYVDEIKQLKLQAKSNKHHASTGNANNGSSITEINPAPNSSATSTITVNDNCQLISVNVASGASSGASTSTSYSSSSASENTDIPSYSGAKSKAGQPCDSRCTSKRSSSSRSSNKSHWKDKPSSRYGHFYEDGEASGIQNIYMNSNQVGGNRATKTQNDGNKN